MKSTLFVFLTPLLFANSANAQVDTVRVGDTNIDASYFEPFKVNWVAKKYSNEDDPGVIQYRVDETYEIVASGDSKVLKFTQYWNDKDGENLFTSVRTADLSSMEYLAFHTGKSPGGIAHLDFDGRYIKGFTAFESHGKAKPIGAYIDEPAFASFSGVLYALILKNYNEPITIPGFGFGGETPTLIYETLEVVSNEPLSIANKSNHRAKVVRSSRSSSNTYWVDSNKAPYFLKVVVEQGNGEHTIYEIEDYKLLED